MVRPIGRETVATEKIVCYFHRSQRKGACQAMQGTRVSQELEGKRRNLDKSLYCGFLGKEQMRQGKLRIVLLFE